MPRTSRQEATTDTERAAAPTYIRETSWYNFLYKQEVHDDTGRGLQQFQGESQDLHAQGQRGRRHPSRDQRGPGGQRGRHDADDYDSLMETLRVYQNPYLSDKVMRGMAQVRQGQTMAHDLVEAGA